MKELMENIKIFMDAMAQRGSIQISEYHTVGGLYDSVLQTIEYLDQEDEMNVEEDDDSLDHKPEVVNVINTPPAKDLADYYEEGWVIEDE